MMKICDVDGDGNYNFTEFLRIMMYNTDDKTISDPSFNAK